MRHTLLPLGVQPPRMAPHLQEGDVRITSAEPLRGERGEIEIAVTHSLDGRDEQRDHRFVYRYEYDEEGTPEGFTHTGTFVSWRSENDHIEAETFLTLSHVEQYLYHYGINAGPTLAPGLYPRIDVTDAEAFSNDTELDVRLPVSE